MPFNLPSVLNLQRFLLTIACGILGVLSARAVGFPAPYLSGPTVAVALGCALGLKVYLPANLTKIVFVLVGILMGTSMSPGTLSAIQTWPVSFIAVFVAVIVLLYAAYWVLRLAYKYDHNSAMLAASPGHLSYVLALASTTKTDIAAISVIQSVRLLALTLSVPIIIEYFDLIDVATDTTLAPMSLFAFAVTTLASLTLGLVFERLRLPAALLLGGVTASGLTHISGAIIGSVPDWISVTTYLYLGCLIGSRFGNFSGKDFKRAFSAGLVVTVVVVAIAAAFAIAITWFKDIPLSSTMIAFAPGGLETMSAMAIMMHADTAYVGAHHILRLIILTVLMPLVLKIKR